MDWFTYDVFLSFRGPDTRHGFTGHLWNALDRRGICTFFDKVDIQKGEEIAKALPKAIEESRTAIVVLSPKYASSAFCLRELSRIFDCIQGRGRFVWPVFYDVNPADARWLVEGTFKEAMDKHETSSRHTADELKKWKNALHKLANLFGTPFKTGGGYKYEFIEEIVEEVSRRIKPFTLYVDKTFGLELQKQRVKSLLNLKVNDEVCMVGIHGIGGIGKTTLAKEVYNLIADQFKGSCFLAKVREHSEKLHELQEILLSKTLRVKKIKIPDVDEGIQLIQQRLRQKKVLLLLDDVDELEQLQALGRPEWFGPGSRILITTRDIGLLQRHEAEIEHEVTGLNDEDALKLLRWKAFKTDDVSSSYAGVLNRAVIYASGLPLALEVIGSHLFKSEIADWIYALDQYERIPHKKIQTVLEVSYNALDREIQSAFLDIACFFNGYKLENVEKILQAQHGDRAKGHVRALVKKSLIKISESDNVTLHDLIEAMGKEIVQRKSPEDPGKRSRLWNSKDIVKILEDKTGTSEIEVIYLDSPIEVNWDGKAFEETKNLRTLIIKGGCHFSTSPKYLPKSLRILIWKKYTSSNLPCDFYPKELTMCLLAENELTSIKRDLFEKKFKNMRVLNLDGSRFLTEIPDISSLSNLEEISFQHCQNLITIDDSVGLLGKLKILHAQGCIKLKSFPPLKLVSLEELDISYCDSLESFPPILDGLLGKLKFLCVNSCGKLKSFPLLNLASLEELDISYCCSLQSFPSVVDGLLSKLKILRADGCCRLKSFPPLKLTSLEELYLTHCLDLESFPLVVDGLLDKLKILCAQYCINIRSFPPLKLDSLEELDISYCDYLESFPEILGEVKGISELLLEKTPIKELPFSFRNLTQLRRLYLSQCGIVKLPRSIVVMSELAELTIVDGGWLFPEEQDEGEEKVSPMQSSQVELLHLRNCNLSDESLAIGLKWFANVKELDLSGSNFTTLPECIKKCQFLWKLILDDCEELQEIKGIPASLKKFSAANCKSLTLSCKSKLLNQELDEAGNTWFCLPGEKIPQRFDHQCKQGQSIFFWFRNKFPAIAFCVVSQFTSGSPGSPARVIINDRVVCVFRWGNSEPPFSVIDTSTPLDMWGGIAMGRSFQLKINEKFNHLHLFHMQMENSNNNMDEALLQNKWNHAEVDLGFPFKESGIHVLKEKSSMEDIRFTNPEDDVNIGASSVRLNSELLLSQALILMWIKGNEINSTNCETPPCNYSMPTKITHAHFVHTGYVEICQSFYTNCHKLFFLYI